ncbi:Rib/alpha-like domain-containing protein [Gardnerella sp. KA00747]|uniref:Rib/alpha-like domain-containing protein n=1 Tax=Gardnerella sp. KA00747 TaxID=2749078 RepID=UPI003BAD1DD6
MANNTRKKNTREQAERSFTNIDSSSASTTLRKMSLSALATVLTAATCLGGQPILASSNILLPPTTAAFAAEVHKNDPNPWLHKPNILEYQRYRYQNSNGDAGYVGDDQIGDWDRIKNKSMMYARVEESGGNRYLVFDVFFNNDGKSMLTASKQQQYVWQVPFAVADLNNGAYKSDTVTDLRFDFYKRNEKSKDTPATLSHDIQLFEHDEKKSFSVGVLQDGYGKENSTYTNTLGIRAGNSKNKDIYTTFHTTEAKLDPTIKKAIALPYPYSKYSYGLGLKTTNVNYAVKLHCKVKLRPNVTKDEIQNAFTWTNTSSFARNTNSSYTFISGRTHDENFRRTKSDDLPPKLYFNGKELTDNSSSITVYQGESNNFTFGTSDNSEKVTNFSVGGFPGSGNDSGNFNEINDNGMPATENSKHTVTKSVALTHKNGDTPVNSDYTITVSATDASGNKAEKTITVHLRNQNLKHKAPTTTPITVDWGHKPDEDELKKHVSGADGGTLTFDSIPETKIPEQYFNGKDTLPAHASGKVTYSDGSYHNVTVPVNVRKPLSLQHKLNGNTVNATVGDPLTKAGNKVDAKKYLGLTDTELNNKKIKSAEWVNGEPSTDVAGKKTYTAKVTFNDDSTAEEKVTFTVRPKQPKIETDLTGVAGVENKEVVVNAGPGTEGSTVTLKDSKGKQIGTGKVGADGKVTITVKDGIPEGKITAVTTTADSVSSDESEPKNASKDDQKPTLAADKNNVEVEVGKDLTITLTAKDNLKVDRIDTAAATIALFNNDPTKLFSNPTRAGSKYDSKNTDTQKKLTYTFSGFKSEEIGTYNLTFKAFDSAGNESAPVTVTVKVKEKLANKPTAKPYSVEINKELGDEDAKKTIARANKLPKGTKFTWAKDGKPNTSTVGTEKDGKVVVTIPTNDKDHPQVETVDVKVTVKDTKSPKVTIWQKGEGDTYNTIDAGYPNGKKHPPVFTINTYRGDKNDIKITATDNSGEVTTLTLTPKTPGETENAPTGTGTDKKPKTLILDGTTPLNTEPGKYKRTITAVDPSGNTTTVAVEFVVKTQAEKYSKVTGTSVTYKMSSGTTHPKPEDGIAKESKNKLPNGTKYSWAQEPDWNTPGKDTTAEVLITFPDGSTEKVDTKVTVKDDIAPVILEPHTNKGEHNNQGKKEFPYMFKVHKDKSFDIEINAYDNSGKISSEPISKFPGYDGKITIDNSDKNSAEKPATIHIKGTAQRADNTNPDANKWSRELVVTDKAGNKSKLKVQISVYTDAEEHTATASKVNNPASKDAIKDAIKITKYDASNTPIDKNGITFDVEDIPTKDGNYAIPVTIHYKDGSSSKIEVPIVVKSESNNYDPVGKTITVDWNSKEDIANKIKSFDNGGGLTWKDNNSPSGTTTVEIVNAKDVPNTDKPGESKVQVKVTYSDGSSDVATVTVKVLDPQSETYTPEGQTITIAYNKTPNKKDISSKIKGVGTGNGIKLKKNGETTDLTKLPDDVASIAIDDDKTVPDGTQPGDFTVPVTITYKDGSKSRATVKVKVGEPQNKKYEPKQPDGIKVDYNGKVPSDKEIEAKVKFEDDKQPPAGTTITVDDGQIPINTTTPGIVNVKVTVTYPDGSEDHVEVPVTVGDPDNVTHKASATPIELKRNKDNTNKPSEDDIKKHVKTGVGETEEQPNITVATDKIPNTNQTGTTNVPVTITYKDGTSTTVQVPVIVTDTNADEYTPNVDPVEEPYGTDEATIKKAITDAVNVTDWPEGSDKKPTYEIAAGETIPSGTEPGTKKVKVKVTYPDKTSEDVIVDVTIKNKQSDTFKPKVTPVVKQFGKPVTSKDVTDSVTVPNLPEADKSKLKIELNNPHTQLPDGKTPGNSTVEVKITYPDKTEKVVEVPVTISNKQSELYPPTSKEITKDNGKAPTAEDIKKAVEIPNWPSGNGDITKTVDPKSIPNGEKGGTFNVPVTVTYPDGSSTVINVPVTIKAPTATAKKVVTVPKGAEPKPEDMIANKDKFPDGTQFEWSKKPDTKTENNGVTGKVKITIPGSDTPQEVEVTVNVVDPTASEVNVLQGKSLPEAKAVIKDSDKTNKYPSETKFEWKPEDKPDTNNSGPKTGKIIVTLPGQKPKEVPVTVNVLPTPVAKVVNVKVGDDLPDASKGIANKDKFPEGTTFKWEESGKPTTDTVGEKKGGKVKVTIPGVNGKTGTSSDVEVTVNVTPKPNAKVTTVAQNSDPDPKNSIENNGSFPDGTTFTWGTKDGKPDKPDTSTTGNEKTGTVVVTVPGQEPQTVTVKVNVTASPEGKDITVLQNNTPDPSGLISNKDKLTGATFGWKKDNKDKETGKPDTSKTGNQPGVVTVQVPGMTPVDVPVNVFVVPNPKDKTVNVPQNGNLPNAKDMIANNGDFPEKTTFTWADNGKPSTSNTGEQTGTVSVAIPGITNPVNVKVTVNVVDKDKPFINDGKAENKPDSKKTTITGKTQPENTVTVKDNSGKTVGTPVKADEKGNFTIEIDKKDPNTKLKLVPSKGNNEGTPVEVTVTAKPNAPTITVPSDNAGGKQGDGNVTVTPPTDATVTTVEITVKPNPLNGPEQPVRTIVVKNDNGTWKIDGNNPTDATVDNNGNVTIPAKNLEDGSTITAVAKNKNNTSDTATNKTGYKTPQIKNEGQSSPQITDNNGDSGKQTITGVVTVPGATVTVTDKDGNQIGTGTAGNDGSFTITINKQKPGAIVTLTPTNGKGDGAKTGDRVELTVGGAIATPKISTPNDGSASVTPDESDTRVNKVVVTYTPEGSETTATITVVAEGDNRVWKIDGNTPEGVTVNPDTGVVTIPAGKIKNGSTITAQAKQVTKNTGATTATETSSAEVTGTITTQKHHYDPTPVPEPTPTPAPTVTTPSEGADQGSAIVTPPADVDTLLITFLPEGSSESATPVTITVKKDKNGNWTIDGTTPTGVTVDPKTGKVTIPATAVKGGSEVTAQAKKGDKQSEKVTGTTAGSEKKQPKKPGQEPTPSPIPTDKPLVVTPQNGAEQGSATVTPPADADSMEITYTPENEETSSGIGETEIPSLEELTPGTTNPDSQEPGNNPGNTQGNENPEGKTSGNETPARVTIKIKKDAEGKWKIDGDAPDGVTVDPQTGKVTIPANKVKDNTEITAKSKKGDKPSKTATGTVGNNPIDDLNIDDLIDNAGGNSNEKGKGHGENHGNGNGNGNNDGNGNGNDNTGDTGNNYTGDAGNKGDTLNPESGTHRIKHGDTIDANGANNNRANGDDNGSTGNGAQGTQGSQDSQGTQSGSQGAPSESQAKIDKIRARHSSGKIAKSKLSNTGAAIAAISTIAALAAAVGGAIAVIRKKKRK